MVVVLNQTKSHDNAEISVAAFTALGATNSTLGGSALGNITIASVNNTGLYGSLPVGSSRGNGINFPGNLSSTANLRGMGIGSSADLMTSKRGFQEYKSAPIDTSEVTIPEYMGKHKSMNRIKRSNDNWSLSPELRKSAKRILDVLLASSNLEDPEVDNMFKEVRGTNMKKLVASIWANMSKLGIDADDMNCVNLLLRSSIIGCENIQIAELNYLFFYWKLIRVMDLAVYPENANNEERQMDGRALTTAHILSMDVDNEYRKSFASSRYYKKEISKLLDYFMINELDFFYDRSILDFEQLFSGNVDDDTRLAMIKQLKDIPPSKALKLMRETENLRSVVDQTYREGIASGKPDAVASCEGLIVQEERNISSIATNIFSRYHTYQAEKVLYALQKNPNVPENITEALMDAIIHENLDGTLAEKLGPACEVVANQNETLKMENAWESCLTPFQRAGAMTTRLPGALGLDVDDQTRFEFLHKNDAGLEGIRSVVAGLEGVEKTNVDYVMNALYPEAIKNATSIDYKRVGEILKSIPEVDIKLEERVTSLQEKKIDDLKKSVDDLGRDIRRSTVKGERLYDRAVNKMSRNMIKAAELQHGEYWQMQEIQREAQGLIGGTSGELQKLCEEAASLLYLLAAKSALITDEFNTLDCIWNDIGIDRGNAMKKEGTLKEYFQAFIRTTTSGVGIFELRDYFRIHLDRVNKFVSLLLDNDNLMTYGIRLEEIVHTQPNIDWHLIGITLQKVYKKDFPVPK